MTRTPMRNNPAKPPMNRRRAAAGPRRSRAMPTLAGRAAFARAGFSDPTLVLRWAEIAGPEIARIARPLKFSEATAVF